MFTIDNTILVVIDVQEKLTELMSEKEIVVDNIKKMIQGIKILDIPIILTEQYPEGLGVTISEVSNLLSDIQPTAKKSFSCCSNDDFMKSFESYNRKQVILIGIETHVCVYQTAAELISKGYEVQVVADAVSSRSAVDKMIGLDRVKGKGASLTSVETALLELLKVAEGPQFKEILGIIK